MSVPLQLTTCSTITRKTYFLGGQAIVTYISGDPLSTNNGFFYLHSDHLGSTSLLTYGNGQASPGTKVNGSETRYYPYGSQRGTQPTQSITDRNFTGQAENLEIGMLYYNARFYLPGLGRFLTADTIVPNAGNPQSFNRYTYVRNNPIGLIDPTGHNECGTAGTVCDDPRSPSELSTSQNGLEMIELFEGRVYKLYDDNPDPTKASCTVGIGHRVHGGPCSFNPDVHPEEAPFLVHDDPYESTILPKTLNDQEINELYMQDIAQAEHAVKTYVTVSLTQAQFDALVSFVFNIGYGNFVGTDNLGLDLEPGDPGYIPESPVLTALNNRDYDLAAEEMGSYQIEQYNPNDGVRRRRGLEERLFGDGYYPTENDY